jgi:hypothetical protein
MLAAWAWAWDVKTATTAARRRLAHAVSAGDLGIAWKRRSAIALIVAPRVLQFRESEAASV